MPDTKRRVLTTLPLEIAGVLQPAGTEIDVSGDDAEALIAAGRAKEATPKAKREIERAAASDTPAT